MLCPEGQNNQTETVKKEELEITCQKKNKVASGEGSSHRNFELNSLKHPKTWKKTISNFFRNQQRSTKSNDGDGTGDRQEDFEEKDISPEQKWQSLGKMFRRQTLSGHWNHSPNQLHAEGSSQNKRSAVRSAISNYFGKTPKSRAQTEN